MCGITGFFSPRKDINLSEYYSAHRLISHRGPDDEGFAAETGGRIVLYRGNDTIPELSDLPMVQSLPATRLMLGHRRLSIIDLSPHGHQPFQDDDGILTMVYNGELFNYIELRDDLKRAGMTFRTSSDTEVVLKAIRHWGPDAFNRFNGMWALAAYDRRDNSLLLSRDRFGIKPLYYTHDNGTLFFSSEMKFLRSFGPSAAPAGLPDADSARDYLDKSWTNHHDRTFWRGIRELEPGHWLRYDGNARISRYWTFKPDPRRLDPREALAEFSRLFEDSLRLRMRSDVEVGTLLSGGLDSTTIVCALHKLGFIRNGNFKAFSAVFREREYSEQPYIDETLRQVPMTPHTTHPEPEVFLRDFSDLLMHMEEPVRSLSVYSQFRLYRDIREKTKVKVVLNGQGADELFGGYSVHYSRFFASLFWGFRWRTLSRELLLFLKNRKPNFAEFGIRLMKELVKSFPHPDYLTLSCFDELKKSALREYLRYDDRNSMAFGIEARVPFLDYRIVEFAFRLDESFRIRDFENKRIERDYARPIIPASIANRKDKMGFISPQEIWQRHELKPEFDRVFLSLRKNGCFGIKNAGKAADYYDSYTTGRHNDWSRIWRMFCLYRWSEFNDII